MIKIKAQKYRYIKEAYCADPIYSDAPKAHKINTINTINIIHVVFMFLTYMTSFTFIIFFIATIILFMSGQVSAKAAANEKINKPAEERSNSTDVKIQNRGSSIKTDNFIEFDLDEKSWFYHNNEFCLWHNNFSGRLSLKKPKYNLQTDFKRDGDFKSKNSPGFSWFFRAGGRAESYINFIQLDHSSDLTASGDINYDIEFDGRKFNIINGAATINFRLKIDAFDFMILRRLKNTAWGHINFMYGVRAMQCDLVVKDINSPVSASYNKILPLPNIGFDARYNITKRLGVYGRLPGFALRRGDRGGRFNNLNTVIEYNFKNEKKHGLDMAIAAGYKEQYIEAGIEENTYVTCHKGPIAKFIAKF